MAFQDLDRVADPDGARSVRDQVLPEDQLLAEPAAPAEQFQGLPAALPGRLIDRGDHAAPARLGHPEGDGADPDPAPAVLGPRAGARDHHTRPEPVHRDRWMAVLGEPAAERLQRAGAGEQQRVAIGEAHPVAGVPVVLIYLPARRIVQVDEADIAAQQTAEPVVGLLARRRGADPGLPDRHRHHLGVVIRPRHRDLQRRVPGGGQGDRIGRQRRAPGQLIRPGRRVRRGDPGQRRFLTLADEPAGAVDHEPPAVAGQAPRFHGGLAQIDGAAGLERIDMDRREAGRFFHGSHVTERAGDRAIAGSPGECRRAPQAWHYR